jgi:hypothetical protein
MMYIIIVLKNGGSMRRYRITKEFVSGPLKGIILSEETNAQFKIGKIYSQFGMSAFKIIMIRESCCK